MYDLQQAIRLNLYAQIRHGLTSLLIRRLRQGATMESIAEKLGWSIEDIWEPLRSAGKLTERHLAELVWALDGEIDISLLSFDEPPKGGDPG